jgi:hypothetical protein
VQAIKAVPIHRGTNNIAEAQALLIGLVLAKERQFNKIHIEGNRVANYLTNLGCDDVNFVVFSQYTQYFE